MAVDNNVIINQTYCWYCWLFINLLSQRHCRLINLMTWLIIDELISHSLAPDLPAYITFLILKIIKKKIYLKSCTRADVPEICYQFFPTLLAATLANKARWGLLFATLNEPRNKTVASSNLVPVSGSHN